LRRRCERCGAALYGCLHRTHCGAPRASSVSVFPRAILRDQRAGRLWTYGLESHHRSRSASHHAYGTEAMASCASRRTRRGGELDGNATAADLGLGRMVSTKKDSSGVARWAGRACRSEAPSSRRLRSARRHDAAARGLADRSDSRTAPAVPMIGRITSVADSPTSDTQSGSVFSKRLDPQR